MGIEGGTDNKDNTECDDVVHRIQIEPACNGIANRFGNGVGGSSGGLQTYKRRKRARLSSETSVVDNARAYVEVESHLANQADVVVGNTSGEKVNSPLHGSNDCPDRNWRNVVLKGMYESLIHDKDGIQGSIREALDYHPKSSCTAVKGSFHSGGNQFSLQGRWASNGSPVATNGDLKVMRISSLNESDHQTVTERCQQAFYNVLISEKFKFLCKVLCENFQGIKPESIFDFSLINSRMKDGAYEKSPTLFLSDIQQVWKKLQDCGKEIISLANSLSTMSKASYCLQVGGSVHSISEDEKQEFCTQMKAEQTDECRMDKICACRHCGDKADGKDCLICDLCEEMYHVSCIKPPVKEIIPYRSWYCASCAASGNGSSHDNCAVCERLNASKIVNRAAEKNLSNEESPEGLKEDSDCSLYNRLQIPKGGTVFVCKICGNEVECTEDARICGHPFCPNKCYHKRCLTHKQLQSYGPRWYCPSCLCRACLTDKDDDKIVLCDGCDHAYHIYCMKPPRATIPKRKWFCTRCDAGIQALRSVRKAFESKQKRGGESLMQLENQGKRWNGMLEQGLDKVGGMDMLLTAAKTLNYEEKLTAIQN